MSVKERLFCFQPRMVSLYVGIASVTIWGILFFISLILTIVFNKSVQNDRNAPNKTAEELQRRTFFDASPDFIGFMVSIIVLILSFISIIVSALLIQACRQQLKKFLLPWLIWNAMEMVCFVLVLILAGEYGGFVEKPWLYLILPLIGVYVYLWVYVLVCYKVFAKTDRSVATKANTRRLLSESNA